MSNVKTMADYEGVADTLGAQAGLAPDTQVKFLMSMVEGGYHNTLDVTNKNKHGTDIDDAAYLAERYVKARNANVIFDAKDPNQAKLISTLRTSIKLGAWPKGGNGEPIATVNNLINMRQQLRKVPAERKKLDDAANTLLKYARVQLKRDQLCDDAELKSFCYKKTNKAEATAEEIIDGMVKKLDKLISGKASNGNAFDNSPEVIDARNDLRKRLSAIATSRGKAQGPSTITAKVSP